MEWTKEIMYARHELYRKNVHFLRTGEELSVLTSIWQSLEQGTWHYWVRGADDSHTCGATTVEEAQAVALAAWRTR